MWGGEFGRTAYSQGALGKWPRPPRPLLQHVDGRRWHQGGITHGETDDFAYNIARIPSTFATSTPPCYTAWASTTSVSAYRFQGLDQRLTGVEHAHVVKGVL